MHRLQKKIKLCYPPHSFVKLHRLGAWALVSFRKGRELFTSLKCWAWRKTLREKFEHCGICLCWWSVSMVGRSLTQPLFATMSDTIVVSPAGLPYLKITNDCGTEITDHVFQDCHRPSEKLIAQTARCMSVSNLNERRLKHSDEEVTNMRNKFLILTRNRAIFKQLERNQKWTLALICTVYFVCFCTVSMLSTFFYEVYTLKASVCICNEFGFHLSFMNQFKIASLHNISTSTYGIT